MPQFQSIRQALLHQPPSTPQTRGHSRSRVTLSLLRGMVASDSPTRRCRMSHLCINTRQPPLCRRQPLASHIHPPHTFPRIWLLRPMAPRSRTTFLESWLGRQQCQGWRLLQRGRRRLGTCRGSWRAPFLPPLLHKGGEPCRAPSSLYLLASPEAPYLFIDLKISLSLDDAALLFIRLKSQCCTIPPTTTRLYLPIMSLHLYLGLHTCPF